MCKLSQRLRTQYPEEMTIILQHQFWDLEVSDDGFEVGLSFGGVPERLSVPFAAIKGFFDPSVQFGLQFEDIAEGGQDNTSPGSMIESKTIGKRRSAPTLRPGTSVPNVANPEDPAAAEPVAETAKRDKGRAEAIGRRRSCPPRPIPQEIANQHCRRSLCWTVRRSGMAKSRKSRSNVRTESDSFGALDIAADRHWGAQTQRSLQNFRIGTERMPLPLIHAFGIVKRAAAEVNLELKSLDAKRAKAIVAVAADIAAGKLDDHFPLLGLADRVWHTDQHESQRGHR